MDGKGGGGWNRRKRWMEKRGGRWKTKLGMEKKKVMDGMGESDE